MNEKIEKLAEEANVYRRVNNSGKGWDFTCLEKDLEKFVEMIVKECAEVADNNFNRGFCPVGSFIKEHFGVE